MNPDLHASSAVHAHRQVWPLAVAFVCAVLALVYVRGWRRLHNSHPNEIPAWRVAAFISGLFCVWIVVGSPLSALDHQSLTIHMINHLVLMTIVPPLLLAMQGVSWLQGLPNKFRPFVQDMGFRSEPLQRLMKHPVFSWLCGTVTVIGWHLPAAFQLAERSHWWHQVEYASFVVAGLLFWRPVISAPTVSKWPRWSTPVYLFLATLPCDILSAFLVFCGRVIYPSYLSAPRLFALSPLEDQQCAGALMWVAVTFAYLVPAVLITMQILSPAQESSQPALDVAHTAAPPPLNGFLVGSLNGSNFRSPAGLRDNEG
jgi:putative membrane protein